MKNYQIIALVVGSCLLTFVLSVLFSVNMVSISPENLAKVVKQEPLVFMEALKESAQNAEKQAKQKAMEENFKNPLKINTEGRVTFGNPDSPITIVEFSDFQCPYCSQAAKKMASLRKKYKGKVNLVYKHFPLHFHPFARPASEYFEAVAMIDHEKAKKFHDTIFYNFSKYASLKKEEEINTAIKTLIKEIGLDFSDVEKNLEGAKKIVDADLKEAQTLNVGGTPNFFVNGIPVKGIPIESLIDKLLETNNS